MFAVVSSTTLIGAEAVPVRVEAHSFNVSPDAKPDFTIVGLADSAVKEARERVRAALRAAGIELPRRVLVNLSPVDLRKEGGGFDLAIALAVAAITPALAPTCLKRLAAFGELGLNGEVRRARGAIARVAAAIDDGASEVMLSTADVGEGALIEGARLRPVSTLAGALVELREGRPPKRIIAPEPHGPSESRDLAEVVGQERAKRALLIAAAGNHHLLLLGPPGCGKSMLAERLPTILPPLTAAAQREVVKVHSIAGEPLTAVLQGLPPFRAPHHGISDAGLIGGGSTPRPGELSLAHHGVLFLDELPEFRRSALEALRAPLERGSVIVARARGAYAFPTQIQLIAAMNPCPCGLPGPKCRCSAGAVRSYLARLSRPILDRIDLYVAVEAVPIDAMVRGTTGGSSRELQKLVLAARQRCERRYGSVASLIPGNTLIEESSRDAGVQQLLSKVVESHELSARGVVRLLRVARTIADLEGNEELAVRHIAEAASMRRPREIEQFLR